MSCLSLAALPTVCGQGGNLAGLQSLYVIAHADLAPASGTAGDPTFTQATNGTVSAIGTVTGKNYVEVGLLPRTTFLDEDIKVDLPTGSQWFEHKLTLPLADITTENRTFLMSVLNQDVSVMVKTQTGKFIVAGLSGGFRLSGGKAGTGAKEGDLVGYSLEFFGVSRDSLMIVDPTIVAALIS